MSETTPTIPDARLAEVRATLRAALDEATVWPDLDDDQTEAFDELVCGFMLDRGLPTVGHYYDRRMLAHTLLWGAAIGMLPAKPADVWVSLMTSRALQWIERAAPAERLGGDDSDPDVDGETLLSVA